MGKEKHQASRLCAKANTASESSQVTITYKNPTPRQRPPQRESISISAAGLGSAIFATAFAR